MSMVWPPDYIGELDRRAELYQQICRSADLAEGARECYANDPVRFVNDCVWAYEPRNANDKEPVKIPVVTFPRQEEFILWMLERFQTKTSSPVEKSRDSGATWMAAAFAVWLWLFQAGSSVGFGSRKEMLVDKKGDPGSIFEKVRTIVAHLPPCLIPAGFDPREHSNYMRIINPENQATIVGEAGDNIGRGGRTSVYFVDEAAYIERPQLIEASLTANTDVRIDISSPKVGTLFNESLATAEHKFIFDVRDAPWHTEEWIEKKRAELERRGMGDVFAQEYLRDPTAGIEGQLISAAMVEAALDAHIKLGIEVYGTRRAGMDVADGGRDRHALAILHGILVEDAKSRGNSLAGVGGRWALQEALDADCEEFRFDSIGVGAGVASVVPQVVKPEHEMTCEGWSGAGEVVDKDKPYIQDTTEAGNKARRRKNGDMFLNAKAQAWWSLRDRFLATLEAVEHVRDTGELPDDFDPDAIISISSKIKELPQLKTELSQVTYSHNRAGKVQIEKTPDGHRSPNLADAVVIAQAPKKKKRPVLGGWA